MAMLPPKCLHNRPEDKGGKKNFFVVTKRSERPEKKSSQLDMASNQGYVYLPEPPRVWSRVQNRCPDVAIGMAELMQYKGNVLQHKDNSLQLTKSQVYSLISRGLYVSRKKGFATQTDKYTNPNIAYLQRVSTTSYNYPNDIVSAPNNPAGPFEIVSNPDGCKTNVLVDGGSLVCGTLVDPCSGQLIKENNQREPICTPTSASDVPGPVIDICWNSTQPTYFPKERLTMNTSNTGWPKNYKLFRSAMSPSAPTLVYNRDKKVLQWSYVFSLCIPVTNFALFANNGDTFVAFLPVTQTSYPFDPAQNPDNWNNFFVVSYSRTVSSAPSNTITFTTSSASSA